jgi:serpin B
MPQTPPAPTPDQPALTDGNNAFAVDLYGQLRKQPGNLFFSPESISTAFAMAYAGASGQTASQMATTLHFALPPDSLHPAMGQLLASLNAPHAGYQLSVANALWAEKEFAFLPAFTRLTSEDYAAGFRTLDFKNAPDPSRSVINHWVEQRTNDKIKDLLPPGSVKPDTRLILTNAIYFKGDWQTQFDKASTQEEDFHLTATETVKAPLMHLQPRLAYFSGETFQAVAIPYKTGELSMFVFLPNTADGLSALEQSFTPANAQKWIALVRGSAKVILTLPKFRMSSQFELSDALSALGMKDAFQRGVADFSAMTGKRDLWISAAIHKAFVDVNEEGTEAAAATGIAMRANAMAVERPPVVFRADHPFLFLIRDNKSGSVLFLGRLTDPTK